MGREEQVTVVAVGVSPVTLSDGRTLAPGDGPAILAALTDADRGLIESDQLVIADPPQPTRSKG